MTLPNWLIPSGICTFSGNEQQLFAAIGSMDGKLLPEKRFSCTLGGGAVSFRFKMETIFRCTYEKAPGGWQIIWQARPAMAALALFLVLAVVALMGLVMGKLELAGYTACLLGLVVFLYVIQREKCVEQFTEKFGK